MVMPVPARACTSHVAGPRVQADLSRSGACYRLTAARLPSTASQLSALCVLLQRPSLRERARHRAILLSSGPTELVWWGVDSQTSRRMLMLRPLPRASAPPRSATRLSLAQPEASLVMVLEFFPRQIQHSHARVPTEQRFAQ